MLSIIIATIVSIIIGALWFNPKTFYPVMQKGYRLSMDDTNEIMSRFKPPIHFGLVIIAEFSIALIIYGLLLVTNGDLRIIVMPILLIMLANVKSHVFSFLDLKLYLVMECQKAVSILVMGLIIAVMM